MGQYHNPADEVPTIGRCLLGGGPGKPAIDTLQSMLRPGEVLVALCDKGIRYIAPLLKSQADIDEFDGQYGSGWLLSIQYYAIPEEKLNQFPSKPVAKVAPGLES